jgi:hypothetical protein
MEAHNFIQLDPSLCSGGNQGEEFIDACHAIGRAWLPRLKRTDGVFDEPPAIEEANSPAVGVVSRKILLP